LLAEQTQELGFKKSQKVINEALSRRSAWKRERAEL